MPQPVKIEKNIEEVIANLKGGVGVIRIVEIINKFAPTPEDRMIIFDYFYKVLDKEITVKEFAQNLLQKLSIKQEDRRQLILGINGKIFHYLEDYFKKEISAPLPEKEIQKPGHIGEAPKQIPRPEIPKPEIPRQVMRPEIPRPAMPRPAPRPEISKPETPRQVLRPEIPKPEIPKPEIPQQISRPETSRPEIPKQITRSETPGSEIPRPEMPKREPTPFQKPERSFQRPALGQDRYREPVPEAPRRASVSLREMSREDKKPEPKIQGNIVDLRSKNF